jgi:hypothetical protein
MNASRDFRGSNMTTAVLQRRLLFAQAALAAVQARQPAELMLAD